MNRMQLEPIHGGSLFADNADLWGRNIASIIQCTLLKFCMVTHIETVDSVYWGIIMFQKKWK
jgi:hypothetical protein